MKVRARCFSHPASRCSLLPPHSSPLTSQLAARLTARRSLNGKHNSYMRCIRIEYTLYTLVGSFSFELIGVAGFVFCLQANEFFGDRCVFLYEIDAQCILWGASVISKSVGSSSVVVETGVPDSVHESLGSSQCGGMLGRAAAVASQLVMLISFHYATGSSSESSVHTQIVGGVSCRFEMEVTARPPAHAPLDRGVCGRRRRHVRRSGKVRASVFFV